MISFWIVFSVNQTARFSAKKENRAVVYTIYEKLLNMPVAKFIERR